MLDKVKFLLVDDLEENLLALEALLRRDDLEILTARSGTEALELLLVHDFALAFIDVQMPNMNGFELAELMRGSEKTRHVPIIFVTAGSREPHRVFKGYESGAVDFLFKPIDPYILRHKADIFFQLYRQRQLLAQQFQRIQESEALLRGVMDATAALIYVKDTQGKYITVNRRFSDLFGREPDWILGRTDTEVFPEQYAREYIANDHRVLESGEAMEFEECAHHADGEHTYVSVKVPLRDASGKIWAVCGVSTDISDRKRLEADLAQAVQTRDDILAIVSHDLRSPLSVISATVGLLLRSGQLPDNSDSRRQYDRIRRNVEQMNRLIGDLMDMASIRSGRLSIERRPEKIGSLVHEAVTAHEALARERKVELRQDVSDADRYVLCDHQRVLQVFANLCGNALKFTGDGGHIVVSAQASNGEARFAVADSGPGIAPEELARVFDPYWSGNRHEKSGTGLGLYITRGIVEAHGGRVWAESEPGRGTTMYFTLPLDEPDAQSTGSAG